MVIVGMLGHFFVPNRKDQKYPSIPTITYFSPGASGREPRGLSGMICRFVRYDCQV